MVALPAHGSTVGEAETALIDRVEQLTTIHYLAVTEPRSKPAGTTWRRSATISQGQCRQPYISSVVITATAVTYASSCDFSGIDPGSFPGHKATIGSRKTASRAKNATHGSGEIR